jgi:lysophospholipase L1-like esterase
MMRRHKRSWRLALTTALVASLTLGLIAAADAAPKSNWFAAWGFSQQGLATETLANQTIRMITRPTLAGDAVRVTLENTFGTQPLVIGAAYVGYRTNGALLVAGSNTPLTFGGASSVTIPAGGKVVSDAAALAIQAMQDVAISLYLPGSGVAVSQHANARVTSFATPAGSGNHAAEEAATSFTLTRTAMYFVTAVDVLSSTASGSIVAFGDSITDGTGSTLDGYDRWHDVLGLRLLIDSKSKKRFGVVNEGIGGNRIIHPPAASPLAVDRLDRDVLARSGASTVIFFEGTNDVAGGATADEVIAGAQQIITRVKAAGLQIIGVTMIPRHNAGWTAEMTGFRHIINDWIRNQAGFDAIIDFDAIVRNPNDPDLINVIYDLGDHIHPNPLGYLVIGSSIDLSLFSDHGSHK